jgi:serine/threonine protein kinase
MNITQTQCVNPTCLKVNLANNNFCTKCGTKLLLAGHYRVIKLLGEGVFGRTFIAVDEHRWNSPCVIKQFLPLQQEISALQKAQDLFT